MITIINILIKYFLILVFGIFGLTMIGDSVITFIILSLIFVITGFFIFWIGIRYFKTGIIYGYPQNIEKTEKEAYAIFTAIFGAFISSIGFYFLYWVDVKIIMKHTGYTSATYLAVIVPTIFVLTYALFLHWYWKKEPK
jgi:hypothetical protein